MAKTATATVAPRASASRSTQKRQPQTMERAIALCPHLKLMENIARTFPLEHISDANADEVAAYMRTATKARVQQEGEELAEYVKNETGLDISLGRIVASFVANAVGAGTYYQSTVSTMRDINTKLANDSRDEDRDGPSGFESKAERARMRAAEAAAQAFIMLAKAEGAISAFAHVTGNEWKAYEAPQDESPKISSKSAAEQVGAFEG